MLRGYFLSKERPKKRKVQRFSNCLNKFVYLVRAGNLKRKKPLKVYIQAAYMCSTSHLNDHNRSEFPRKYITVLLIEDTQSNIANLQDRTGTFLKTSKLLVCWLSTWHGRVVEVVTTWKKASLWSGEGFGLRASRVYIKCFY